MSTDIDWEYYSIHTSDKNAYLSCRQQWDFSSELRRGWRPKKAAMALDFGTAIHAGLEVLYEPTTWWMIRGLPGQPNNATPVTRRTVYDLSIEAFHRSMRKQKKVSLKLRNLETFDNEEEEVEYKEHIDRGVGMLEHYFTWHLARDTFTPIAVEITFSLPIRVACYNHITDDFDGVEELVALDGKPIRYEGRLDLLLQDDNGKYWVWDDKTAARFVDVEYLELDEQCLAYIWAARRSGFPVVGMVYNELYKGYPQAPQENKILRQGRRFSVNKQQDTTYEAYVTALVAADEDLELYDEFLAYLKENPKQYFVRQWLQKSKAQLARFEAKTVAQVREMLDPNLAIYNSPNRMKCTWCAFRAPCISREEDGDFEFILKANYFKLSDIKNRAQESQTPQEEKVKL